MATNVTDWALNATARFVEQERVRSENWEEALQRHQRLVSQAPVLWESIREALQTQIRCFNEGVGKQILSAATDGDHKLVLSANMDTGARTMTAEFDSRRQCITCSARTVRKPADFEARLSISLNSEDNACIALPTEAASGPEPVAGHMLNGLMGWHQPTAVESMQVES